MNAVDLGLRGVLDSRTAGYYRNIVDGRGESQRKTRTVVRGIAVLARNARMLNPVRYGLFAWQLARHKLCRWLVPFAMIGAAAGNAELASSSAFYQLPFGAQIAFYMEIARILREEHRFQGYIHLKTIAGADPGLIALAGLYADRLSTNVELPTEAGLSSFAPEKKPETIRKTLASVRVGAEDAIDAAKSRLIGKAKPPRFAPAGQSTQMIVGADASSDATILASASTLYASSRLRRVYYSAYSPIPRASAKLPGKPPPLVREHRLYLADWMLRYYGFRASESTSGAAGMLDLDIE